MKTRKGKYLGKRYDGWTVIEQVRYTYPKARTGDHYDYYLAKLNLITKQAMTIFVAASTIVKLDRGELTMEKLLESKNYLVSKNIRIPKNAVHKTALV